jgi:tetratricopeptide (TPR) repeat protein
MKRLVHVRQMRWETLVLAGILLGALALRVAYLRELVRAPDFRYPLIDAAYHDYWARALSRGDWSPPRDYPDPEIARQPFFRPPGYPCFLALIYAASAGSFLAPRLVQMGLGLLNVVLVHRLGRRAFGRDVGLVGAALAAGYWAFIYFEGELVEPVLLVALGLGLINVVQGWSERRTAARAVAGGVLLGLFALVRPNVLLFVPVLVLWMWWVARRRGDRRGWRVVLGGFLPAVALTIAPATLRNYRVTDHFVLITANAGVNLYIGNNPETDCVWPSIPALKTVAGLDGWTCFDYPRITRALERKLGQPLTHSDASAYFTAQALAYVRTHPTQTLARIVKKAALFWGPAEISNNKVTHYERLNSPTLRNLPDFPLALSWAAAGLLALVLDLRTAGATAAAEAYRRQRVETVVLLVLFVTAYFMSYLPYFVADRYRVPLIPFLLIVGAYGLTRFGGMLLRREFQRAAVVAVAWVGAYAVARTPFYPYVPDLARWHYDRGRAFSGIGQRERAASEYAESIRLNPDDYRARVNLGLELSSRGRAAEALEQFQQALRVAPDLAVAHRNVGLMLARQGRQDEAITAYRRAVELDPDYSLALVSLGNALRERGETAEAITRLRAAIALVPGNAATHNNLGLAWSAQGELREAEAEYREALRLNPNLAEAHYNLGRLYDSAGRDLEAAECYRAAIRAAPGFVRAHGNLGAVLLRFGQVQPALDAFRDALKLDPRYVPARYNLGRTLERLGRTDEAIIEYRTVLQIDPGYRPAQQALAALTP